MIRFISVVLLFALFVPFAVPAAAAGEYSADDVGSVNLLTAAEYYFHYGSMAGTVEYSDTPQYIVRGYSSYGIRWITSNNTPFKSLIVTVTALSQPSSVSYAVDQGGDDLRTMTYVGMDTGSLTNRYYYRIDNPDPILDYMTIFISFSSTYRGDLGIAACFGYKDNTYPVANVDAKYTRVFNVHQDAGDSDGFTWETISNIYDGMPSYYLDEFWWGENTYYRASPLRMDALYTVDLSGYNAIQFATVDIAALGPLTSDNLGFNLIDQYGNVFATLDYSIVSSVNNGRYLNTSYSSFLLYEYCCRVDLSGYDIKDLDLQISVGSPYLISSSYEELSYGYIVLHNVALTVDTPDLPWYSPILRFFNYIWDLLEYILMEIRTLLSHIKAQILDIYYEIQGLALQLLDHFNFFVDWSAKVLDSLTGSEEDQQEAEQFEQDANKSNQDLTDLSGKMDSVDRPDIDNINISVDSYIPADGITLLTSPFNIVFGNGYIFKILSVSLIMALVSYVLFGKR